MPLMHGDGSMGRANVRRVTRRNVQAVHGIATQSRPRASLQRSTEPGKGVYKRPPAFRRSGRPTRSPAETHQHGASEVPARDAEDCG
jgi:hypothetical protein